MRKVIIESPYAGDVDRNVAYARVCMKDALERGDAPIASHLLYTQPGVLDDNDPDQRTHGIDAGLEWAGIADLVAVYMDLGMSPGMEAALERYARDGVSLEFRRVEGFEAKISAALREDLDRARQVMFDNWPLVRVDLGNHEIQQTLKHGGDSTFDAKAGSRRAGQMPGWLQSALLEAVRCAKLEGASFENICSTSAIGLDESQVTDFIKERVRIHHDSWIVTPIMRAMAWGGDLEAREWARQEGFDANGKAPRHD
jgi:hypothetical protein